jgi:TPR repeat protein
MSEERQKVPSQIFRWFEKMKSNYEHSVQSVLTRFEQYSQTQQIRLDKANSEHVENLKTLHQSQNDQNQANLAHLHQEIDYFKQQIQQQQQTIEQLNTRYDAVMSCLLSEKQKEINIKEIFDNDDFFTTQKNDLLKPSNELYEVNSDDFTPSKSTIEETEQVTSIRSIAENASDDEDDANALYDQALNHRQAEEFEQAFALFQQAAQQCHDKAMGAMGRCYFLGEGITEDHTIGLAWLIKAADQGLPQAISRVQHFEDQQPALFAGSMKLVENNQVA